MVGWSQKLLEPFVQSLIFSKDFVVVVVNLLLVNDTENTAKQFSNSENEYFKC